MATTTTATRYVIGAAPTGASLDFSDGSTGVLGVEAFRTFGDYAQQAVGQHVAVEFSPSGMVQGWIVLG